MVQSYRVITADSGSNDSFSTGETLTFTGGEGIDTTVSDNQITIPGKMQVHLIRVLHHLTVHTLMYQVVQFH